ncbi:MAG: helix-turn-helix transcriptional regulator [Clostridia bacterium]|nr:helix-turn-helix transcriptional regulator [Clostridia bacterium]
MRDAVNGMVNARGIPYGDLIRDYRKKKGLSQEQLGAVAHVKKNAVSAWEAGRSRPDMAIIPELCRRLDLPLYEFFGLPPEGQESLFAQKFDRLSSDQQQLILKQMDEWIEAQGEP